MRTQIIAAIVAVVPSAVAAYTGFNYGSTFSDGTNKVQSDYEGEFNTAKNLVGAPGFTSARLFTTVSGITNGPIEAIPAAIATQTTLLLGLWASSGQTQITLEINALTAAINTYGTAFTDLIAGISVGSEDVYRTTDLGIASNVGPGATPDTIVGYIQQVRNAIAGTSAAGKPVGHVDTYNTWTNTTYTAGLVGAVDFIGMDAYPYYESTKDNSIGNANATFWDDYQVTVAASQGKPVWITETGWPHIGATSGAAVASIDNAATYYSEVACSAIGADINLWYFILQDQQPVVPSSGIVFGVTGAGNPPPTTPLFDLSC